MTVVQSEGQVSSLLPVAQTGWARSFAELNWNFMPRVDRPNSSLGDYAAIYATQPNVRTVVSFLARNIAQLGLHAFRRVSDTERSRLDQAHELSQLIESPHRTCTRYGFIESLVTDLGVYGNHYSLKVRDQATGRLTLLRFSPHYVRPMGKWTDPEYVVTVGATSVTFPASSIFHLREYNPENPIVGLSPLDSLKRILAEDIAAGDYREGFWNNAARIETALKLPVGKKLSPDAAARLARQWQALYAGGSNSGKTAILEDGMDVVPMNFNAKDSEYLGARKLTREEVAAAYHVSPAMVGILEHANFANIDMQHQMLYQDTLGPRLVMIAEEYERQVLPDIPDTEGVYLEFNIDEKLKGSFEEQTKALQAAVGGPWLTRNEARAMQNKPPLAGGELVITPMNVTVGGQASPQDSAPKMLREVADRIEREMLVKSNGHREVVR